MRAQTSFDSMARGDIYTVSRGEFRASCAPDTWRLYRGWPYQATQLHRVIETEASAPPVFQELIRTEYWPEAVDICLSSPQTIQHAYVFISAYNDSPESGAAVLLNIDDQGRARSPGIRSKSAAVWVLDLGYIPIGNIGRTLLDVLKEPGAHKISVAMDTADWKTGTHSRYSIQLAVIRGDSLSLLSAAAGPIPAQLRTGYFANP